MRERDCVREWEGGRESASERVGEEEGVKEPVKNKQQVSAQHLRHSSKHQNQLARPSRDVSC